MAGLQTNFPFWYVNVYLGLVCRSSRATSGSPALRFWEPGMLDSTGMKPAEAAMVVVSVVYTIDVLVLMVVVTVFSVIVAVCTSVDVVVIVSVSTGKVVVMEVVPVIETVVVDVAGVVVTEGVDVVILYA